MFYFYKQIQAPMKPKAIDDVSAAIVLDTRIPRGDKDRRKTKDEKTLYPVRLRIIHQRKAVYYKITYNPEGTGAKLTDAQRHWLRQQDKTIAMTPDEFANVFNKWTEDEIKRGKNLDKDKQPTKDKKTATKEPFATMNLFLSGYLAEAKETLKDVHPFSFEAFKTAFFEKPKDNTDLMTAIAAKAAKLKSEGKISTADLYKNCLGALQGFTGKQKLSYDQITPDFLVRFEKYILSRKIGGKAKTVKPKPVRTVGKTTASMYLRSLRSSYNEIIPEGTGSPFATGKKRNTTKNRGKFFVPEPRTSKRAITYDEVLQIAGYKCTEESTMQRSRDLWLFSYLVNGISFKDIALLKYSDISPDAAEISFSRAKTGVQVTAPITKPVGKIIDRWGTKPGTPDTYIFPIFKEGQTPERKHAVLKQFIKITNKYIKRICNELKIPEITSYSARHSFATILKLKGGSLEFISEAMGHTSIKTTQNSYQKEFARDERIRQNSKLLPDDVF